MKGLELCRQFYIQCGKPLIRERLGAKADRFAAGLAGFGSECLGFDDEISRDHDFGPDFCLWLTDEDYEAFGNELTEIYNSLPREFMGYSRSTTPQSADRHGVTRISHFYSRFTGCRDIPADEIAWLKIPEHLLAAATSGEVFDDTLGEFTRIRNGLLNFYPGDVRLKKLAARIFAMAQAGQYNFPRITKRGDAVAASLALGEFTSAFISAAHLINRRYTPFYKWSFKSAMQLPILSDAAGEVNRLWRETEGREEIIESICRRTAAALRDEGLSSSEDTFLAAHSEEIVKRINSERLRKMGVTVG